jgi:hypothetical protein
MSVVLILVIFVLVVLGGGMFYGYAFNEYERDTDEVDTNEYAYVESLVKEYPEIATHIMQLDSGKLTKADMKVIRELETKALAERRREKLQAIAKETIGVTDDESAD